MKKFLATAALVMGLSGNAVAQEPPGTITAANTFTLALAQQAIKAQADKLDNLVVSPYNVMTALSLAGLGANMGTRDEFAKVLYGATGEQFKAQVDAFAALDARIIDAAKDHVTLNSASGIWANKNACTLDADYVKNAQDTFHAEVSAEDFANTATVDKINAWAAKNTNNLISKVIQKLTPEQAIVIASALYFKGEWLYKFDKSLTEDKDFTPDGGSAYKLKTMKKTFDEIGQLRWQDGQDYEAAALGYGKGESPTMRIVLVRPKDAKLPARDWLAKQDTAAQPLWLSAEFQEVVGTVELPRIDIKQNHDMVPVLQGMGINAAFRPDADFRLMVQSKSLPLFISSVSHDVVFKTDEEGSEAAAVTTMTMAGSAAPSQPKSVEIKFDRSFVFAVQDVLTGAVLFMGAVNKPAAAE